MIDTIATRAFNLNGTDYAKGDKVPMPAQQFEDLEPTGLVTRAPGEKKARAARKPTSPAPVASEPVALQSIDAAD